MLQKLLPETNSRFKCSKNICLRQIEGSNVVKTFAGAKINIFISYEINTKNANFKEKRDKIYFLWNFFSLELSKSM